MWGKKSWRKPDEIFVIDADMREAPLPVVVDIPDMQTHSWNKIPLGVSSQDEFSWDIHTSQHALITGPPGSGKTMIQRNILRHCAQYPDKLEAFVIDLKSIEPYVSQQNTTSVTTSEEALQVLRLINSEVDIRSNSTHARPEHKNRTMIILIDDIADLLGPSYAIGETRLHEEELHQESLGLLAEIAQRGRSQRIHLVINKRSTPLPPELNDNLSLRIEMGNMTPMRSERLLDSSWGTQTRGMIPGRGVIYERNKETIIQVYYGA